MGVAVAYLFGAALQSTILGALITMSRHPWYPSHFGTTEPFELAASDAVELFHLAADHATSAGLTMSTDTVVIEPMDGLRKAIEHALVAAAPE